VDLVNITINNWLYAECRTASLQRLTLTSSVTVTRQLVASARSSTTAAIFAAVGSLSLLLLTAVLAVTCVWRQRYAPSSKRRGGRSRWSDDDRLVISDGASSAFSAAGMSDRDRERVSSLPQQ
jgi:hypothetical protein